MSTYTVLAEAIVAVFQIGLLFSMTETVYREIGVLIGVERI